MKETELTPKQAFNLGVEKTRALKRYANELTQDLNNCNSSYLWYFLGIEEVRC